MATHHTKPEFVSRDYLIARCRAEIANHERWLSRRPTWDITEENHAFGAMNYLSGLKAALEHVIKIMELPASAERDRVLLDAADYPPLPVEKEHAA